MQKPRFAKALILILALIAGVSIAIWGTYTCATTETGGIFITRGEAGGDDDKMVCSYYPDVGAIVQKWGAGMIGLVGGVAAYASSASLFQWRKVRKTMTDQRSQKSIFYTTR
ncbi:MAG: hypothetical protein HY043_06155 [Verrucomicrobia bacterium]|nr:hypothetical protein [Verrucomicrobiota bacterium]